METQPTASSAPLPVPEPAAVDSERDQITQNLEAVLDFYTRENQKISPSQGLFERISLLQAMNQDLVLAALDTELDLDRLLPGSSESNEDAPDD